VARRKPSEGIGRLAAALASNDAAAPRIENRLVRLTVTTRWVTILAGIIFGFLREQNDHFALAAIALVVFAGIQTIYQLQPSSSPRLRVLVIFELVLTVAACTATGGLASPFVLTPVTGFLLAGYVWGRRALVGTIVAGVMAVLATLTMQIIDASDTGAAGQIAVVFLLCGALGAFTRNLITDIERHRDAALDQAADLATANELLVSLHGLAQTLPASFDLREVVESTRTRLRSLFRFSALVVLVRDDAQSVWTVELAEGVRLPSYMGDHDLPQPLQHALESAHPVIIEDRLAHPEPDEGGFAALARSGLYTALRARGAVVGLVALEDVVPDAYGGEQRDMIESLSGLLALSIDNARWFARLRTLGAEAERARIARELHDRVAQSLAYVAFELERMHNLPGDRDTEIVELHEVVRGIVRELRETIYQLRSSVTEEEDIVMVAGRYLERFSERTGIARVGVIDFQDTVLGPQSYDVVSLLQDARIDVPENVELTLLSRYIKARRTGDESFDPAGFAENYAIMSAQRNTRLLGTFARLNRRDGKPQYLRHQPRIWTYLQRSLAHPALTDLRDWYQAHVPPPRS